MTDYCYKNFIPTLAREFTNSMESIRSEHGFELGTEFEVILCKLLRRLLPKQYGVCRGYLTSSDGELAGDDIVIFNNALFPTMALRQEEDYSRKEYVPIEAVCCYIEAKYTVNILGDDGQSLKKALSQVDCAKELCRKRKPIPLNAISPHHNVEGLKVTMPEGWPDLKNPLFTAIIASQVRKKKGEKELLSAKDASKLMAGTFKTHQHSQDLCILGPHLLGIPVVPFNGGRHHVCSPFQVYGKTTPMLVTLNEGNAFALGLVQLMWALDWMQLGKIPWANVFQNALDIDQQ